MFTALDIEIATEFGENWRAQRPLGITCAAVKTENRIPRVWHGAEGPDGRFAPRMSREDVLDLLHYLLQRQVEGDVVVGWNSLAFDLDVIGEECGEPALAAGLALAHVDIAFQMLCEMGYMVGLGATLKGLGMAGKLMHGEDAPRRWKGTRQDQDAVLAYVVGDAEATAKVYEYVAKTGHLFWITQKGVRRTWQPTVVEGRLLTVQEANGLPLPDTSWMTQPRHRAEFLAWAVRALARGEA